MDTFEFPTSDSLDPNSTLIKGPASVAEVYVSSFSFGIDIENNLVGAFNIELETILDINTAETLAEYSEDTTTIGLLDIELSTGDVTKISYIDPISGQSISHSQYILSPSELVSIKNLLSDNSGDFIASIVELGELILENPDSLIISEQLDDFIQKFVIDSIPIESIPIINEPITDETTFDSDFLIDFASSIFDPVINTLTSISNRLEIIDTSSDILIIDPETNLIGVINDESDDLLDINTGEVLDTNPGTSLLIGLLQRDSLTGQLTGQVIYPDPTLGVSSGEIAISQSDNIIDNVDDLVDKLLSPDPEGITTAVENIAKKTLKFVGTPKIKNSIGEIFGKVSSKIILDEVKSIDPVLSNIDSPIGTASNTIDLWRNAFERISNKIKKVFSK